MHIIFLQFNSYYKNNQIALFAQNDVIGEIHRHFMLVINICIKKVFRFPVVRLRSKHNHFCRDRRMLWKFIALYSLNTGILQVDSIIQV